jgi:hypothetical protein
MLKKTIKLTNGDFSETIKIYRCNICNGDISESWPHYRIGDNYHLCLDCAFRNGKFTGEEWLRLSGFCLSDRHEPIVQPDGTIIIKRKSRK